jgi:hypothetical protein
MKKFLRFVLLAALMVPIGAKAQSDCYTSCPFEISCVDSWGDGWNGNAISVYQGDSLLGTATISSGSTADFSFNACETADSNIYFIWTLGSYPGEASFTIYKADGSVLVTGQGSSYSTGDTIAKMSNVCPTCIRPTNLVIDSATSTAITLHWSAGGSEYSWFISLNGTNWTNVYDTTYVFGEDDNILPNTDYTIYIASDCSGDTSAVSTISVRTACGTIAVYPWTTSFEGESGATPSCWTNISGSTDASNSTTNSHSGDNYLIFSNSYINAIAFPPADREWNQLHLNFWTRPEDNTSSCGSFSVGYYTDITNSESFVALQTYNYNEFGTSPSYMEKDVALDSVPDGAVLAFRHNSNTTYYYWYVDDVTLSIPTTCDRPSAVAFSEIGTTSLEVTINGDEDGTYQLYLYNNDTIVDSAEVSLLTHTFTNLLPGEYYTVSVAAVCDDGGVTLPITNSTLTNCMTYDTLPIVMDFENVITGYYSQWFDPCWHKGGVTSSSYLYPYVTSGYLYCYTYNEGEYNWFTFPNLGEDIEINTLELSFDVASYPYSGYEANFVVGLIDGLDYNDTMAMDTIAVFSSVVTDPAVEFEPRYVSFAGYTGEKRNIVFVIRSSEDQIDDYYYNYVYFDNINLHAAPNCARPMDLTITGMTETTATINWSSDAASFEYTLEYPGNDTATFTTITTTDTFAVLTGMMMDSDYVFTVRGVCDDANSDWMSLSFHQGYCLPAPTSCDNQGITEVVFGVAPLQVDNDSLRPTYAPFYGNYSAMVGAVPAGTECTVDITYATSYTYGTVIWVDWNNNMQFEGNEVVYVGTSSSTNPTTLNASFVVPLSQDTGYYRMRIAGADSYYDNYTSSIAAAAAANPCPSSSYTVVHDYTLQVTEAPSCLAPMVLSTASTANSITVNFDGGAATSFEVMWTDGTTNGNATVTASPYTITGLTPLTTYTISLFTHCTEGNSDTTTVTATTTMLPATLPYTTGFEAGQDVAWATVNSSNGWYIGTAINNGGNSSLYVSDNSGTTNNYNTSNTSFSYAYKLFTFDSAQYGISFDWKAYGESDYDFLRAWIAPASFVFTAGQTPNGGTSSYNYTTTSPAGWIDLGGKMNLASEWQSTQIVTNVNAGNYYLVFMWANDNSAGTNPPAAIDNIVVREITCYTPDSLTVVATTANGVTLAWQPTGSETSWEVVVGNVSSVVNTNPATITGLNPGTYYTAKLRAICGAGDSSFFATTGFFTECLAAEAVPFKETFEAPSFPHCWKDTVIGVSSTTWSTGIYHSDDLSYIYSSAPYEYNYNNWLISPAVAIPATDTTMLRIAYQVAGLPSSSYATSRASYMLLVSPTGSDALTAFTDTLLIDTLNTNVFQDEYFPVGQYAGQNIRIAIRNTSFNYGAIYLNEVGVRYINEPLFYMGGRGTAYVGDTNAYYGIYSEGDLSTMTYSWTSSMVAAGQATMTGETTDTIHIIYNTVGTDTLTFIATNIYGADTNRGIVHIFDINPVSVFPYTTGFEPTDGDNYSWITRNGSNGWNIGTATNNLGTQSLYISNDGGVTNAYTVSSSSVSFVSRAFNIVSPGNYTIGFDWKANGESNYDYLRAFFVPDADFTATANNYPDGSSSSYDFSSANVPNWINVGGKLNLSSDWTREEDTISITTPGRYHLVFLWSNDPSVGTQPPAAIDNIEVNNGADPIVCNVPNIQSVNTTETTATVIFIGEATDYEVAIVEGTWTTPASGTAVSDTTYTFTGLTGSTAYTIGVRSVCYGTIYSEWVTTTITTDAHPCYAPTGVAATNITLSGATIAWTPGEEGQTNFELRYSTAGDTVVVNVTENPYTLTGLLNATEYSVAVRAICGEGNYSDWSTPATFTTASCQMVQGVNVPAATITTSSAVVNWTANGSSSYEVGYGPLGTTTDNCTRRTTTTNSYTITGLEEGTNYVVYVRSICGDGIYSDWTAGFNFMTTEVGIDDVDNNAISLYPNPASSTVTLTGIEGEATVTVVDMNGRESGKWKVESGKLTIDVTGYAQGAYFVRITGERVNAIRKLIVR